MSALVTPHNFVIMQSQQRSRTTDQSANIDRSGWPTNSGIRRGQRFNGAAERESGGAGLGQTGVLAGLLRLLAMLVAHI